MSLFDPESGRLRNEKSNAKPLLDSNTGLSIHSNDQPQSTLESIRMQMKSNHSRPKQTGEREKRQRI